jgi:hypothetical protein
MEWDVTHELMTMEMAGGRTLEKGWETLVTSSEILYFFTYLTLTCPNNPPFPPSSFILLEASSPTSN